jgi:hypothetical protein
MIRFLVKIASCQTEEAMILSDCSGSNSFAERIVSAIQPARRMNLDSARVDLAVGQSTWWSAGNSLIHKSLQSARSPATGIGDFGRMMYTVGTNGGQM